MVWLVQITNPETRFSGCKSILGHIGFDDGYGASVAGVGNRREYPQGGCMNSNQSSSEQFGQHLKSVGGSESDVSGSAYVVTDKDTVESVVSGLRIKQQQQGGTASNPSILHASAQVLISRRDEHDPAGHAGTSMPGEYQLDIHLTADHSTRESIPEKDLEQAQIWAKGRIEAEGADFGSIYFPAGGGVGPGTGALECSYDRAVGWYR